MMGWMEKFLENPVGSKNHSFSRIRTRSIFFPLSMGVRTRNLRSPKSVGTTGLQFTPSSENSPVWMIGRVVWEGPRR